MRQNRTLGTEGSKASSERSAPSLDPQPWGMILAVFVGGFVVQIVWTNAELLLPLIQVTYHTGTPELAWVLAAFPIGYALFAFPGSVVALHWGHRNTAIGGMLLLGASAILSAYSNSIDTLILLRFAGGAGAGMFFAPTAALLSEALPERLRARVVGLYASTGLGIGGALGFIEGALLGPPLGWPRVFLLTGVVCLGAALLVLLYLPVRTRGSVPNPGGSVRHRTGRVLRSGWLWGLTVGLAGLVIGGSLLLAYISTYVIQVHPGWGIEYAGALGSIGVFFTIPGSLLGSRLSDGGSDRRTLAILLAILFAPVIFGVPYLGEVALLIDFAIGGLLVGAVLPLLFAMPSNFPETEGGNTAVAIGVIETSQVLLQGGAAVLFGSFVVGMGFTATWAIFGVVALATIPALIMVPSNRASGKSRERASL